jgi:hypothetical protein
MNMEMLAWIYSHMEFFISAGCSVFADGITFQALAV